MLDAKISQSQILAAIIDLEEVFRSTDGETAFATVTVNDHRETWPIRSKVFRRWLVGRFYGIEGKPPSAQALQDALGAIEARAHFGGHVHDVHVRLAGHDNAIYLDLCNERWEAVEVAADGWRMVTDPPVKFRRTRGMLPLPRPDCGGSLEGLRSFVNASDAQWPLLVAWLIAATRPRGPFPVLVLGGEHGSAKSTTAEVLRRLLDPNCAMLRAEPRDVRDVMIAATNGWCLAYDNLSSLDAWLSDALCRLATGGGFATRELYSDADETIFHATRPVVLNGVEEIVVRPDLLDRALLLDLPPIPETHRRAAGDFWRDFDQARPRLLGALFDAVSVALSREKAVTLSRLPRMADFAVWVTAAAPALGWAEDHFMSVYATNREQAHEAVLDASPIAAVIRALTAEEESWTGTAAELLEKLTALADTQVRQARTWPATPRLLGATLRRLAPNLRAIGVEVQFPDRRELGPRRRQVVVQKVGVEQRSERSHRSYAGFEGGLAFPGNEGPFHGNDDQDSGNAAGNAVSAARNDRNDGNGAGHLFSAADPDEATL